MPSLQNAAPGAKSSIFKSVDPFYPFVAQLDDEPEEVIEQITQQTDERLRVSERSHGHALPTNLPATQQPTPAETTQTSESAQAKPNVSNQNEPVDEEDEDSFNDSDFDDDEGAAMEAIRQRRLAQLKASQVKHAENVAKGHKDFRTISQDEFLPECTGSSEFVAVHFFHDEFERCKIMDHHLKIVVSKQSTCKFLRIDAEKAPFFVEKLNIRTLPTLIVFRDGKAIDRLIGFEGLATAKNPDKFPTRRLQEWLAKTGAIVYKRDDDDESSEDEEVETTRLGGTITRLRRNRFEDDI